jgi:hypothetical protein
VYYRDIANLEERNLPNMLQRAEKVARKKTNRVLATATKRYKRLMRQAAKAANARKREQYIAAALGALIVTGVVASEIKARIAKKKTMIPLKAGRKRRTKRRG